MPRAALAVALCLTPLACVLAASPPPIEDLAADPAPNLEVVAEITDVQITGVAVTHDGRIFVNAPNWHGSLPWHVAEWIDDPPGPVPYPPADSGWNSWLPGQRHTRGDYFVCVQSVHADERGRLWALDAANPSFQGVSRFGGGPKLVMIDTASKTASTAVYFDESVAPENAYLNDVRIECATQVGEADYAYITDSGTGALIVAPLSHSHGAPAQAEPYRVLLSHPSTQADEQTVPIIAGRELRFSSTGLAPGQVPQIHADGLALDARNGFLYWQPLTARRLFRIPTHALKNRALSDVALARFVEDLGPSIVTDGMEIDEGGNLYFSALEHDAIVIRRPTGQYQTLVADPRLAWPDSFAIGHAQGGWRNALYVTSSQIHRIAWFTTDGSMPREPYRVFRLTIPDNLVSAGKPLTPVPHGPLPGTVNPARNSAPIGGIQPR